MRQLLDLRLTETYWYSTLLRSSLSLSLPQFSHFPQDQSDWTWQRVWFHFPSRACTMAKAVSFGFRPSCTFLFERSCDCETMKCFAQFKTSFCASIHLRSNCTPVQLTHRRFHSGFKRRRLAPCSLARCTSFSIKDLVAYLLFISVEICLHDARPTAVKISCQSPLPSAFAKQYLRGCLRKMSALFLGELTWLLDCLSRLDGWRTKS